MDDCAKSCILESFLIFIFNDGHSPCIFFSLLDCLFFLSFNGHNRRFVICFCLQSVNNNDIHELGEVALFQSGEKEACRLSCNLQKVVFRELLSTCIRCSQSK